MRHVITATAKTDVEAAVGDALRRLSPGSLDAVQRQAIAEQIRTALTSLVEQGRRLATQGSQMRAERRIELGGVEFLIRFTVGVQPTLLDRLRRTFGVS